MKKMKDKYFEKSLESLPDNVVRRVNFFLKNAWWLRFMPSWVIRKIYKSFE